MALNEEEYNQAAELLVINERKLRIRDRQIERYGDNAPPEIILDAEDIRRRILALKAILEPELPDEISGLIKRRLEDDYFIFQQTLGAKQDVALLREDVAAMKQSQSLAATWRMQTDDWKERIEARLDVSEEKRAATAPFYRRALVIALSMAVLALIVSCSAFIAVVR